MKVLSESRPLARTSHTCTVCGATIPAGTRYQRIVARDYTALDQSRAVTTYKWHLPSCPQPQQDDLFNRGRYSERHETYPREA